MPDGSFARFWIEHSLVVERGLLKNYPELGATYRGHGIDDPTATVRFDFLPNGFHSMILSSSGTVIVDPYSVGDRENYISYYKRDRQFTGSFTCEVKDTQSDSELVSAINPKSFDAADLLPDISEPEVISGTQLRTYRLALAANNEYCVAVGGNTVAGSLAAQVLIMNRVNGVYERDVAIHMNLVANNNLVVYAGDNLSCGGPCTSANDPYSNGTGALNENTPNLNAVIGSGNYDIGHVFTTGSGGVAQLGVPCGSSKGAGTTGLPSPIGDPFAIDFVAHEMGHQWSALHTFNSTAGNCGGGNRSASAAYEPGSGITIMAYAGICSNQDLANNSIDTFHVKSLEQIVAYSQSGGGNVCAVTTASGNTPPTVTGPGNFNIPKQTAFALTATGSDPDVGDMLTYDWQEYDLGASTTAVPNTDADGNARPIFRPYLPSSSPTRYFPSLQYILANANVPPSTYNCGRGVGNPCLVGELLPAISRVMTFQVVARDNHAATGGINTATSNVTVDGNSGPFVITSPNTGVSYAGNTFQTVTWDVANTSGGPVNAANVKISFSSDGGNTFPTVISASTANDGTESVLIPNTPTTTARIKVEAVGNIFFDISDVNFTVTAGGGTPTATATATGSPSATATFTPTATPTCNPGAWQAGPAQAPSRYAIQGVIGSDNMFYTAGGQTGDATPVVFNQVSRFDPTTNTWSNVAPLPTAVSQAATGAANGKIFVAGGFTGGSSVTNILQIYDIATNTWTTGASAPTAAVEAAAAAVVNGKFYVIGGDDFNNGLNSTLIYDIATNTWSTGATLPDMRTNTYGTVANGLIYVYGGVVLPAFTTTDSLLRYDPVANSWTNLGSAGTGLGNYGGISPYGTDQLLIANGADSSGVSTNGTRIFTISGGTFGPGPAMITGRAGHAQATLPDGRVLIADGFDTATTTTSSVELLVNTCTGPSPTPTSTATATNTPTPTATGTPTATSTPTATPTSTPPPSCPATITQSTSQTVVPGSVACTTAGVGSTQNSYWRAFTLSDFGVPAASTYNVSSVSFGVETVTTSLPITVNLYTTTGFPTGFPGSLTLIGTGMTTVVTAQAGTVVNVPLAASVPPGTSQLVMEVNAPDGTPSLNFFFIGSNTAAETGPSYLSAADCGITTPTTTAAIGFPNMHIIMNVNGSCPTGGTPSPTGTATATATATPTATPGAGCDQNFDGVTAPALPAGWTTTASGVESPWVTTTAMSSSAPNSAFAPDPNNIGDTEIVSPAMSISAGGGSFSFQNNYNTESTFDGMVLEISVNGGAYQDILAAGGSFVTGGYNATISVNFMSPIAGRMAWSGNSGGFITTTVNLPASANGQSIQPQVEDGIG